MNATARILAIVVASAGLVGAGYLLSGKVNTRSGASAPVDATAVLATPQAAAIQSEQPAPPPQMRIAEQGTVTIAQLAEKTSPCNEDDKAKATKPQTPEEAARGAVVKMLCPSALLAAGIKGFNFSNAARYNDVDAADVAKSLRKWGVPIRTSERWAKSLVKVGGSNIARGTSVLMIGAAVWGYWDIYSTATSPNILTESKEPDYVDPAKLLERSAPSP